MVGLTSPDSHRDGAYPRHPPRNCRRFFGTLLPHRQMRMMAMMLRTMTLMCFLHAGIPSATTVGSTTALMLFRP